MKCNACHSNTIKMQSIEKETANKVGLADYELNGVVSCELNDFLLIIIIT